MATGTAGNTARHGHDLNVRFIRKGITYSDNGTTVVVGTIPSGSVIIKAMSGVQVTTAFDGNATNTLDIGYSTDSGTNNLATALALGTATFVPCDEATGDFTLSADRTISALVTSTASATAGAGEIVICFVEDLDG